MRVLIVHNFYQIHGGEDGLVRAELTMLRNGGIDAELFSATNDAIKSGLQKAVAALNVVYNPSARRSLRRVLANLSPDVVHIHNFFPLLSPAIFDACRDAGIPSVLTLHNFRILCPTAFIDPNQTDPERSLREACWWTVPKKVYRNSAPATLAVAAMVEFHKRIGTWTNKVDRFIALTDWAKDMFVRGGIPVDRISVKPNWVQPPPPAEPAVRNGALFVGRLHEQKGVNLLLEAWRHLDCPLTIIGEGPLAETVSQATNERIIYLGRQPCEIVQREMRKAQFLMLPSSGHEMFPLTILEAFSNRLPIICSDIPSLSGLVEHNITGLKFASGDACALAEQVRRLRSDPGLLETLGNRAHALYENRYTPESNFKQLLDIYRSVCEDRYQS